MDAVYTAVGVTVVWGGLAVVAFLALTMVFGK